MSRPTRVLYVENDPALRGIMSTLLSGRTDITVTLAAASGEELLEHADVVAQADVALLDLALGRGEMNGIDLAIRLREENPNLGIVIHSQHDAAGFEGRVPPRHRLGWATFPKTGDLDVDALVLVLRQAASGLGPRLDTDLPSTGDPLAALTPRQRSAMRLLAQGLTGHEIARQLDTTHAAIRQDLSRAYRCLVPEVAPTEDIRTKALLVYLELTRNDGADSL